MAQSPWDFNEQDGFPEWPATQPYVAPAYNPDDVPAVPKRPVMDDIFAQYDQKSEFSFSDEVIVAPSPKASAIEPEVFVGGSSSSASPSFSPTPDVQSFSNVEIGLTGSDNKDIEDDTASSSSFSSSSSAEPLIAESDIVFEISIPSHEVVGEGISSYVVYVVAFKTNLPGFKSTEGSIKRRYSDFVWLQDQLTNSCKGVIIPPLPDKAVLQTSKLLGNTRFDGDFVEYRRKELHRFLVRTSRHKTLRHSPFFASFLDVVDSAALVANKAEAEEKSSRGLFSRNVKPQEVDLWFVDKGQYLASLSQNLDQLAKTTSNMLIKQLEVNQALSHVTDSSKSFATLESSSSVTLSSTFNRLSQTSLQVAGIQQELCTSVASKVIDSIKDYHRLTASAQRILEIRLEKLAAFQTAHKELDQKSQKYKAGDAKMKAQVEAAEKQVSTSQEIFHTVSEVVRNEMEQFEASKSQELHGIVVELAQSFIDYELRAADLWKSLLNDLQ